VRREIPKITILLATYNGVKFIDEQLASLIAQIDVQIEIHVNDDGSTDGTLERLDYWKQEGLIKTLTHSQHIGATRAFLKLLRESQGQGPVAFCDQDDVWASDKLISQVNSLENDMPMLVSCKRRYIDSLGKNIGASKDLSFQPNFLNALVENVVPGNSMMLNQKAVMLINKYENPEITHYDSWIYLLLAALGECKYISRDLLGYRIHEKNVVGLRKFRCKEILSSVRNFGRQAIYFRSVVGVELPRESSLELMRIISIFEKGFTLTNAYRLFKLRLNRQRTFDRIGFRITLLVAMLTKKL
jgi:glycosyltransferase involved in cell wall biosynthesis